MSKPRVLASLRHWALHDLEPISIAEARIFYVLFFALSLWSNRLIPDAPATVARVERFLHIPSTLLGVLQLPWIAPGTLGVVRILTAAAAICALLGLLGWLSRLLLAMGATTLYLAACGALGHAHSFHLATLILFLLCLAPTVGPGTLDAWLARRFRRYPFRALTPAQGSIATTGFVRKMILVTAVGLLFCGGISKLLEAGWRWADGEPLRFYIAVEEVTLWQPRWPGLAHYLVQNAWIARLAATAALCFELVSPCALFSARCRNVVVLAAIVFHLGIRAVMYPDYTASIVSYLFILDWRKGLAWIAAKLGRAPSPSVAQPPRESTTRSGWIAVCCVYGYCVIWLAAPLIKLDTWPVTHVPMFASYVSSKQINHWPIEAFEDPRQLPAIARDLSTRLAYGPIFYIRSRTRLRAVGADGRVKDVTGQMERKLRSVWLFQSVNAALQSLAVMDQKGASLEQPAAFLMECARSLDRRYPGLLTGSSYLELTYQMQGADVPLIRVPLSPGAQSPARAHERSGAAPEDAR